MKKLSHLFTYILFIVISCSNNNLEVIGPDVSPPVINITTPQSNMIVGEYLTVIGNVSDNLVSQQILVYSVLNGQTNQTLASPNSYWAINHHVLTNEEYDLRVWGVDSAGNKSEIQTISIQPDFHQIAQWTVMIYMDGDNNLESYALQDFNEIESVAELANTNINIIILFDRIGGYTIADGNWTGTRLYYTTPDFNTEKISSIRLEDTELGITTNGGNEQELNMADTNTLSRFVDYCQTNFPASNYFLILWNHGDGWRNIDKKEQKPSSLTKEICYDDTSGSDAVLYNHQVRESLIGKNIDVIGFDACLMGMIEVAYEFSGIADYMIASPESEPAEGWNYKFWLKDFLNTDRSTTQLLRSMISAFSNEYANESTTTLAAYDLTLIQPVMDELDNFTLELLSLSNKWWSEWGLSHSNFAKSQLNNALDTVERYDAYYDFYDLVDIVDNPSSSALKTALQNMVLYEWHNPSGDIYTGNPNSYGISIYFGFNSEYVGVYTNINQFNKDSQWINYLTALKGFPPFEFIGIGNTSGVLQEGFSVFYQFYVNSPGEIDIDLLVPTDCDDDLYVHYNNQQIEYSYNYNSGVDENITFNADEIGWYLIEVNRYESSDESQQYELRLMENTADII